MVSPRVKGSRPSCFHPWKLSKERGEIKPFSLLNLLNEHESSRSLVIIFSRFITRALSLASIILSNYAKEESKCENGDKIFFLSNRI